MALGLVAACSDCLGASGLRGGLRAGWQECVFGVVDFGRFCGWVWLEARCFRLVCNGCYCLVCLCVRVRLCVCACGFVLVCRLLVCVCGVVFAC